VIRAAERWFRARLGVELAACVLCVCVFALGLLLGLLVSACSFSPSCPPAELARINARYVARGRELCRGTPPSQCAALPGLRAERVAEARDAGCL